MAGGGPNINQLERRKKNIPSYEGFGEVFLSVPPHYLTLCALLETTNAAREGWNEMCRKELAMYTRAH